MQSNVISARLVIALICPLMLAVAGCQRSVGVSSPSVLATNGFLIEDTQYFPAGPEFKLENQTRALEEYKREREKLRAGLDDDDQ